MRPREEENHAESMDDARVGHNLWEGKVGSWSTPIPVSIREK